jgi:hypothetical protein
LSSYITKDATVDTCGQLIKVHLEMMDETFNSDDTSVKSVVVLGSTVEVN